MDTLRKNAVNIIAVLLLAGCTPAIIEAPAPVYVIEYVKAEDTLTDWQLLQMAIIMTESEFHPDALGDNNDAGLYQMIPIYVAEVNRLSGADYSHEDAYDIDKAMAMFEIYQSYKNPEHDRDLAIYYHNNASWYKRKVLENYEFVQRYEAVRAKMNKQ